MQTQDTASSQGPASKTGEFAYLDQEEFRRRHVDPAHPSRMFFHVEGVHCTSCLYRIENLKNEMPDVANVRLDMSRHVVEVETAPGAPFSRFAAKLKAMGYTPHPLSWESAQDRSRRNSQKSLLIKIGVAAAAAGNIMLLSTSLYSGAQASEYARLFEWLSFALFLPVLLYSAIPFYSNSWAAFRSRRSSIDVPIVGALVFGTGIGLYHLIVGAGDEYFDSLAVLVFLLLSSRYLLFRLQDRFLAPAHLRAFYETNRVRVRNADTGALEQRHIDTISRGDEVVVYRGERVPVDGPLQSEEAFVNAAVLTGEALPQRLLKNQRVFAGTMLTSAEAIVRVDKVGDDTRVGMLLRETERGVLSKTPLISFADRVAQWFSGSVLVLGLVFAVIYSFVDVQEAINRALALVILACPCALALAIPLTQSLALKKAARRGCLIKKAEAFEKLCQVREAFFDKTGTLTKGELDLKGWWPKAPDEPERSVIYALETHSSHPIAHLLAAELSAADPALRLDDRTEIAGVGVAGRFQSNLYEIRSLKDETELDGTGLLRGGLTFACVYRNHELVRIAYFEDRVREASADVVSALQHRGWDVYLLTGDAKPAAAAVASEVGIAPNRVFYSKSPEEKRSILVNHPKALMVGDGVNDSVALANAYVSVAVHGSMETSFRAADIYLTQAGVRPLQDLVDLAHATLSIIRRNLAFSLVYNVVFGTLALLGFVNPLVAAILMPLSSVTVVLSSVAGNRFWRRFNADAVTAQTLETADGVPSHSLASRGGVI